MVTWSARKTLRRACIVGSGIVFVVPGALPASSKSATRSARRLDGVQAIRQGARPAKNYSRTSGAVPIVSPTGVHVRATTPRPAPKTLHDCKAIPWPASSELLKLQRTHNHESLLSLPSPSCALCFINWHLSCRNSASSSIFSSPPQRNSCHQRLLLLLPPRRDRQVPLLIQVSTSADGGQATT
jgi:hypothetical protein